MSANKKKAKRRTAKAMQNLRKTPEKAISSITETKNPIIRSYGIDEYKDEEYDDEDDGLWPKYCPHCYDRQKAKSKYCELDGNVDED